ncbi:hypothetical protein SAMN05216284_104213 [Micromonospora sediminimaris]|nr:hypothetical protein SAMN05216284_104213 [Micromonospora sediminimaris]
MIVILDSVGRREESLVELPAHRRPASRPLSAGKERLKRTHGYDDDR